MITLKQEQLDAIWAALNETRAKRSPFAARRILMRIADEEWMFSYQLDDLCYESDPRPLNHYQYRVDLEELSTAFGYRWVSVFRRPGMRSINATATDALSSTEAAAFLLDLERLGFAFDPELLVDRLRPAITKKSRITGAELDIFWAAKIRGKSIITLRTDGEWKPADIKVGKLANGYRYEVWLKADASIQLLTVKGPKYRERRSPVETKCPECGHTWWRGDPDSSAGHRKEHRKRMHVLAPQPFPLMIAACAVEDEPELVTSDSPAWKHAEMYRRAYAFKREQGYDFVQWQSADGDDDPLVQGFLMTGDASTIVGAIAFRWRVPDDATDKPFWGLQWVWVCPDARRSGVLSGRWRAFRERFGDFWVEGPVSNAMRAFLEKQEDGHLMVWPSQRMTPEPGAVG